MIEVKHIAVDKGRKNIIKDISCTIRPGKITVAIGKNGAGKSTLLEALTTSNELSAGAITWDQKPLARMSAKTLAQCRAVLSQSVKLSFPISVYDLVEMGCYVSEEALSNIKIRTLVQHALSEVEMLDFVNRSFNTLSGGEQKRVLFAKCIVQLNCGNWANINKYLFLDEPTASLDLQQKYKLLELIKRFVRRRNIGVFAVLHDINLAAQFADEIIVLQDGRLVEKGTPWEVLNPATLFKTLGVHALVQPHPIYNCPHITLMPYQLKSKQTFINL